MKDTEIIAIIPAGGWRVRYTYPDGSTYSAPLVGWALRDTDGFIFPLISDGSGYVEDAAADRQVTLLDGGHNSERATYVIYHPDEVITSAKVVEP